MTERDARAFLADMIRACRDIIAALGEMSLEEFAADQIRQKAVIRDLEVLGEAAANLTPAIRGLDRSIPWSTIKSMRNKLIHEYFGVDARIVYRAATVEISALLPQLEQLFDQVERTARKI